MRKEHVVSGGDIPGLRASRSMPPSTCESEVRCSGSDSPLGLTMASLGDLDGVVDDGCCVRSALRIHDSQQSRDIMRARH